MTTEQSHPDYAYLHSLSRQHDLGQCQLSFYIDSHYDRSQATDSAIAQLRRERKTAVTDFYERKRDVVALQSPVLPARLPLLIVPNHGSNISNDQPVDGFKNVFYRYFGKCPVTFHLENIRIQCLSARNPINQSIIQPFIEQSEHSFVSTAQLSTWLNQHATNSPDVKIRITGTLAGDFAHMMSKTRLTEMELSFECALSPWQGDDLNYAIRWSDSWHNEDCFKPTSQPINKPLSQTDEGVKQKWLEIMRANSPGVRPVSMRVDDDSIQMRGVLKLTDDDSGLAMISHVAESKAIFVVDQSKSDVTSTECRTYDIRQVFRYHDARSIPQYYNRYGKLGDGRDLKVLQTQISISFVSHSIDIRLSSFDALLSIFFAPTTGNVGPVNLRYGMQLRSDYFEEMIARRNGQLFDWKSSKQCQMHLTWEKQEAPACVWALYDQYQALNEPMSQQPEQCQTLHQSLSHPIDQNQPFNLTNDIALSDTNIQWLVTDSRFSVHPIVFRRIYRAADKRVVEYVTLTFTVNNNCVKVVTVPELAIRIHDQFLCNDEDNIKLFDASQTPFSEFSFWSMSYLTHSLELSFMDERIEVSASLKPADMLPPRLHNVHVGGDVKLGSIVGIFRLSASASCLKLTQKDGCALMIPQLLAACHKSSVIEKIPCHILNSVRLQQCLLRFEFMSVKTFADAWTASDVNGTDRFFMSVQPCYAHRQNTILIQIRDSKIIHAENFRELTRFGAMDVRHFYVYLSGGHVACTDADFNKVQQTFDPPASCFLPDIVPTGSHFLTVKQETSLCWTSVKDNSLDLSKDNTQLASVLDGPVAVASHLTFNISLALLCDSRCSSELAQYVLDFVDMSDILFGVNILERAQYNHHVLTDGRWWKRRMTREFGSSVTRWSDETLGMWLDRLLNKEMSFYVSPGHEMSYVQIFSDEVQKRVRSQSIWFSAAISLITRLKTFSRGIMQQNNSIQLPSALIFVLLISPPFQRCLDLLAYACEFWSGPFAVPSSTRYSPHACFAVLEDEDAHCFSLYSGACYFHSDANTEGMGQLVQHADDDLAAYSEDDEESSDDEGSEIEHGVIREGVLSDPNQWPVMNWNRDQNEMSMEASNMHEFLLKHGVYRYCERVSAMWDDRAVTKAVIDSCDEVSDQDDDDEMSYSDVDQRIVDKYARFAPSFQIHFSEKYMNRVMQVLLDQIYIPRK